MKFRIKHISFLLNDERQIVKHSTNGKFLLKSKYIGHISSTRSLGAYDFVTMPVIKRMDPVITLYNGEKHRVFRGGDPKDMVIQTQGIIEMHDMQIDRLNEKREKLKQRRKANKIVSSSDSYFSGADIFEDLHGW